MTLFDAFSFYSLPKPFFNFFLIFQTQAKRTKKKLQPTIPKNFLSNFSFYFALFSFLLCPVHYDHIKTFFNTQSLPSSLFISLRVGGAA